MKFCKNCGKSFNKPRKPKQIYCSRSCRTRAIKISHGFARTPFYAIWMRINAVCSKTRDRRFILYGGRGIKCLWKTFNEFKNDMYSSYEKSIKINGKLNTTIERINNDGHYCKENCRWATRKEQAQNRRNKTQVTFQGKTLTVQEWADKAGISRFNLWQRLFKYHWDIKRAIMTPINR
jgi:hypothetical protein